MGGLGSAIHRRGDNRRSNLRRLEAGDVLFRIGRTDSIDEVDVDRYRRFAVLDLGVVLADAEGLL